MALAGIGDLGFLDCKLQIDRFQIANLGIRIKDLEI